MATALVPVFTGTLADRTVQLCDARALHTFMQVKRDFTTWIKARIRKFGFTAGEDFITVAKLDSPDLVNQVRHGGDRKSTDYHLTLDMAKELAMVENNEQGRAARKYFIECERQVQAAINATPYSVHPGQTLSAEQAETLRVLLTKIADRLPKEKQGTAIMQGWSKLKAHFGVPYRQIPAGEFKEAVSIVMRHAVEWEVVDEAPKLPDGAAPIDPTNAPAMVAAHRVAIDYMSNFRASVREGKTSPSMGEIPTTVLQGILSEAIMRQRMLVSFNPDTGRMGCTVLGGNEFISDWPRLVKDVATGECMCTSAELLDMAVACMQRLQQRSGPARLTA